MEFFKLSGVVPFYDPSASYVAETYFAVSCNIGSVDPLALMLAATFGGRLYVSDSGLQYLGMVGLRRGAFFLHAKCVLSFTIFLQLILHFPNPDLTGLKFLSTSRTQHLSRQDAEWLHVESNYATPRLDLFRSCSGG